MNQDQQPVARVTGYYGGNCVIEPLDGKTVFSSGMAVYSAPVAAQAAQPVAYMTYKGHLLHADDPKVAEYSNPEPLYDTAPPSREFVGLTKTERDKWIDAVIAPNKATARDYQVSLITEAALRAKNSGEQA